MLDAERDPVGVTETGDTVRGARDGVTEDPARGFDVTVTFGETNGGISGAEGPSPVAVTVAVSLLFGFFPLSCKRSTALNKKIQQTISEALYKL